MSSMRIDLLENSAENTTKGKRQRALAHARSVRTPESFRTPARVEAGQKNLEIARATRLAGVGDSGPLPYELSESGRAGIQGGQARRRAREKEQKLQKQTETAAGIQAGKQ